MAKKYTITAAAKHLGSAAQSGRRVSLPASIKESIVVKATKKAK
jgi:hypothetical protein